MNYKTHSKPLRASLGESGLSNERDTKLLFEELNTLSANLVIGIAALLAPIIAMTIWFGALLKI